ncbi:uncharacterized protein LOC143431362 [Xylocopa sonorina]|uniref:uncharacterized protein LOC143431362 n=1 Tax=Xylocopa sonorina TaxID=1818115 RepID=UPI00403A9A25
MLSTTTLPADIIQFWEIEELPRIQRLSESVRACETHYGRHTRRNADDTYIVTLAFNGQVPRLGESRSKNLKLFIALEEKLERNTTLRREYHAVRQEYLDLGHVSEIDTNQDVNEGYYLPHHGVKKVNSQTTKLVFDGTADTTIGVSLITYKYVITGDIKKMFRQFIVRPADHKYQRILWLNATGQIQTYQLYTVTLGLSAVPFLATLCLT